MDLTQHGRPIEPNRGVALHDRDVAFGKDNLRDVPPTSKRPRRRGGALWKSSLARGQFTRVQVWPPQNMPPNAQPWTRSVSGPFRAIVES